jgi:hypothetical protein
MRSSRDMGDPYQHGPEVSIVRTDTGMARPPRPIPKCRCFCCSSAIQKTTTTGLIPQWSRIFEAVFIAPP